MYLQVINNTCIIFRETLDKDKTELVNEINDLRKRGMKVDSLPTLLEAVDNLDATV